MATTGLRIPLRNLAQQLSYLPRTLRLVWAAAPRWTTAWAILLVAQGILPGVGVYLTKLLVDNLAAVIGTGGAWAELRPTLVLLLLMVGLMVLVELLGSIGDLVRAAQGELIQDHVVSLLHQKSITVDISFYESPEYYDRLEQARGEASARSHALLENVGGLAQNAITLLTMSAILAPYGIWLPLVLFASTLPAFYVVLRFDRRYHAWWTRTTPDRRRAQYYDMMINTPVPAMEMRLFGLGAYFDDAYQTLRQRLRRERFRLVRSQNLARFGAGIVALLSMGVAIAWVVWGAVDGRLSLGDLALFYQAFNRGQDLMRALLSNVGRIYNNTLFLSNLYTFLELTPRVKDPPRPVPAPANLTEGITFRNVTFRYPGSERPALEDFSLTFPAGKIVAIVGANGGGKTTLVKLLCRFYDPEAGRIELDGIDIRDLSVADLRRRITVLFQFPVPYQGTAAENISYGDIGKQASPTEIEAAARAAGAHDLITGLPQGYDTQLGKWFKDGVELSGGEWQRIATARAYLRPAPIVVLDEPTSAMDSWAEADWFERLRNLTKGRTGLIITHRFTIAMRADIIHVMDHGRIVESGTHDELIAGAGRYAEAWTSQMQANQSLTATEMHDGASLA